MCSALRKRLTPQDLSRGFGTRSDAAADGVAAFLDGLSRDDGSALNRWKAHMNRCAAAAVAKLPSLMVRTAAHFNVACCQDAVERLLLSLQTYYAAIVRQFVAQLSPNAIGEGAPGDPFLWWTASRCPEVRRFIRRLEAAMAPYAAAMSTSGECDVFKSLYQDLFPRPLRRQLGEYYTPDWLAEHVLDEVGYSGQPTRRLLDPACGSGTFLVLAIRRLLSNASPRSSLDSQIQALPVGFDLSPLAVLTAKANCLVAMKELLPRRGRVQIPVYLHDSIQDCGDRPPADPLYDDIVGNPPWIAWDTLSNEDREATKPLWEQYGLFSLSGKQARHGGGKKDLSMLMLYATADRYLKVGGRLGMVITQTLFQTLGAGDGFRRFRLGNDGPSLRVLRVDDLTLLRPFGNATNWTSTIILDKGAATEYPVPYFRWTQTERQQGGSGSLDAFQRQACLAKPIDPARPTSPWLVFSASSQQASRPALQTPADYTAHLGANTGGANGVYWLDLLAETPDGVLVRNVAARGKHRIAAVEQVIEADLLYPLLRWGDVRRYGAAPSGSVLLVQDPATRTGIDEAKMRVRWPRTLAYLERFHDLLAARAAYRRYQHRGPFYSMYNVGPYTVAPTKVVWRRMDRRINAAVVETTATPCFQGNRPIIPQETCVLVACQSADEAHYLCAMLNSETVNGLVAAHSVCGGKSFGTPGMLNFLPLRRYTPEDESHRRLAELSRQAHAVLSLRRSDRSSGDSDSGSAIAAVQAEIDILAQQLWRARNVALS